MVLVKRRNGNRLFVNYGRLGSFTGKGPFPELRTKINDSKAFHYPLGSMRITDSVI